MQNKSVIEKVIFYIIFLAPFLVFFLFFQLFALNIPFEDDFVILRNLYDMGTKSDIREQLNILISLCNEHSIVISKIVFGTYLWVFKSLHLKNLMLVGNLFFCTIFYFFFVFLKQHKVSFWALLPIPYFLLSAHIYENSLWAMCAIGNNGVIVFACWGIFLIFNAKPSGRKFYWGLFLLACALICIGNGFLSFVVVGLGLVYQQRWRDFIILVFVFLLMKITFLSSNHQYRIPNSVMTTISSFSILVGGGLKTTSLNSIIQLIGFVIMLIIGRASMMYIFKRKKDIFELNILLIALFCLGTLFAVAVFRDVRSSDFPDRYRLYPQLLLVCVYLLIVREFPTKFNRIVIFSTISGIFYLLYSYYISLPNIMQGYQKRLLSSVNMAHNGSTLNGSYYRLLFDETLNFYKEADNYTLQPPIFDIKKVKISAEKINISSVEVKQGFVLFFKNIDSRNVCRKNGYYISLETPEHTFYFLSLYHVRNSLLKIFVGEPYLSDNFYGLISHAEIPPGTYKVGLVSTVDSTPKHFKTDITIHTHKVGYQQ